MIQRDFLLKEIEKIGLILSAILQKLFGGKDNLSITVEKQVEDAKGMLFNDMNFDLDKLLSLNTEDSNEYISQFKSIGINNLELLAGIISQMGFNSESDDSKKYLEKALQIYEFCKLEDKTYSSDREENIDKIKNNLRSESPIS